MGRTLRGTGRQEGKREEVDENEREKIRGVGRREVKREMEGRRRQRK